MEMNPHGASERSADFQLGDHVCFFYDTEAEHRAVLTAFLVEGLQRQEKVVYILESHTPAVVVDYLKETRINVGRCLASGQLTLLDAEAAYLHAGSFHPERMLEWLQTEMQRALAEGYPALRATGEMAWALRSPSGLAQVSDYEAKLNERLPGSPGIALCQYDRRSFEPPAQLDSVLTHPTVIDGTSRLPNPYYLRPSEFLRPEIRHATIRCLAQEVSGDTSTSPEPSINQQGMDRLLGRWRRASANPTPSS